MKQLYCLLKVSVLLLIACHSATSESTLQIKGFFRERLVFIEEYKTDTAEAWADELPPGAARISSRIVSKGSRVFLTRENYTVTEKYKLNTPVYSRYNPTPPRYGEREVTKQRDVYGVLLEDREKVIYITKHWVEASRSKASTSDGDDTREPVWLVPEVDNVTTRIGRRFEYYSLILETISDNPKYYEQVVSLNEWKSFKKGQKVKGTFFGVDGREPRLTSIVKID